MRSYVFRRFMIPTTYLVIGTTSLAYGGTLVLNYLAELVIRLVSSVVFILTIIAMVKVHSMYPKKHDLPSDFPKLLREGPYAVVRHPLYALVITNQLSIPAFMLSLWGLITFLACLPLWYVLIRLEERELIDYWGEEYLRYMREVPSIIPIPRRFRRGGSGGNS